MSLSMSFKRGLFGVKVGLTQLFEILLARKPTPTGIRKESRIKQPTRATYCIKPSPANPGAELYPNAFKLTLNP